MSGIPYNQGIPNPNNNPSSDVFPMLENANSLFAWPQIDHVGFGTGAIASGTHAKITFAKLTDPAPPTPLNDASVSYTEAKQSDVSRPNMVFQDKFSTYLMSAIKAFATIQIQTLPFNTPTNLISLNYSNIIVTKDPTPLTSTQTTLNNGDIRFDIDLTENCLSSNDICLIVNLNYGTSTDWATRYVVDYLTNSLTITLFSGSHNSRPTSLNFVILQA